MIKAMETGRHVIADKPMCTSLQEWERVRDLSVEKKLCVGCMLDMRNSGSYRTLRRLVQEGVIGEVHAIQFGGQHPLSYGSRPGWYFEEGKHGGTLNDIAIHALDAIPWITGKAFTMIDVLKGV